jgi:16S rRNA (uracil1498-N3)-methyltransferase
MGSHRYIFYIHPDGIAGNAVRFSRSESHHLGAVMRLQPGDLIDAADGSGYVYQIRLAKQGGQSLTGEILDRHLREPEAPLPISLAMPCLKGNRWETAVETACEMGVEVIHAVDYSRATVKWASSRVDKMRRKAVESMKQSGGSRLTRIEDPLPLQRLLEEGRFTQILVADPEADVMAQVPKGSLLVIGPEAGFDENEKQLLSKPGIRHFRLGGRRLRSEVAVTAALSQAQLKLVKK